MSELEKIQASRLEGSDTIGAFLTWLRGEGIYLMHFVEDIPNGRSREDYIERYGEEPATVATYWPESINRLLARYYGIDADKAEEERDAILAQLRAMNGDSDETDGVRVVSAGQTGVPLSLRTEP